MKETDFTKEDLIKVIEKEKDNDNWKSAFIKFSHKKNDSTYNAYIFNFKDRNKVKKIMSTILDVFLLQIEECESIHEYDAYITDKLITKLSINEDIINSNWGKFLLSLDSCEDTNINKLKNINAYTFYKNDEIYFISKKNPILNFKKKLSFSTTKNTLVENNATNIQFNNTFDFMVYKNNLYSINKNFESVFNLEKSLKKLRDSSLDVLKTHNILYNIEDFCDFSKKGKRYYKFKTFSEEILKDLKANQNSINYLKNEFNIERNAENKFILDNENKKDYFLKIICGKVKRELLNNNLCETNSSKPLDIKK